MRGAARKRGQHSSLVAARVSSTLTNAGDSWDAPRRRQSSPVKVGDHRLSVRSPDAKDVFFRHDVFITPVDQTPRIGGAAHQNSAPF